MTKPITNERLAELDANIADNFTPVEDYDIPWVTPTDYLALRERLRLSEEQLDTARNYNEWWEREMLHLWERTKLAEAVVEAAKWTKDYARKQGHECTSWLHLNVESWNYLGETIAAYDKAIGGK